MFFRAYVGLAYARHVSGRRKRRSWRCTPIIPQTMPFRRSQRDFLPCGILRAAECLAERGGNVYVHYITYTTPMLREIGLGAAHCINTSMLARNVEEMLPDPSAKEQNTAFAKQLQAQWGNFSRTGNRVWRGILTGRLTGRKKKNVLYRCDILRKSSIPSRR